jgi:transposase-like protein
MSLPDRVSRAHLSQAENIELPISALEAIVAIRRHIDELERQAVEGALEKGATYQLIADTLGVTKQAVNQRFRKQSPQDAGAEQAGPMSIASADPAPGPTIILDVAAEPPEA